MSLINHKKSQIIKLQREEDVIVETEAEYKEWIESQTRFDGGAVSYTMGAVVEDVASADEATEE